MTQPVIRVIDGRHVVGLTETGIDWRPLESFATPREAIDFSDRYDDDAPLIPLERSGAEPSGVTTVRAADGPVVGSSDGGSPETERAISSETPDRSTAARPRVPLSDRFWPKVDQTAGPDACWPWTASVDDHGYGSIRPGAGETNRTKASRVAWTLTRGPIPDGLHVLHTCDNRRCVNPAHLWLGTNQDNVADRQAKGRQARGDRHGMRLKALADASTTSAGNPVPAPDTVRTCAGRGGLTPPGSPRLAPAHPEPVRVSAGGGLTASRALGASEAGA